MPLEDSHTVSHIYSFLSCTAHQILHIWISFVAGDKQTQLWKKETVSSALANLSVLSLETVFLTLLLRSQQRYFCDFLPAKCL